MEVDEDRFGRAEDIVRIRRRPTLRGGGEDHRGQPAPPGHWQRQPRGGHCGERQPPAALLHLTVTRVNFRFPTFNRYTPGESLALGSATRSPSTLTPPWAISRRAS